ncbi:hypothetical protein SynRS9909_02680 [Synechococcus sp. RS9909]|nr:hypothetical protein RS9917_06565 [Synechococcus sp. RS9917]QNI80649.1 hypothetical protein SynRS9909_02680 [Synechococcus sp. RS9909]
MVSFEAFMAEITRGKHDHLQPEHTFVQCLPKMGSTALSASLNNAIHEFEMDSAPQLAAQRNQPGFASARWQWLHHRRLTLEGKTDVCTSLFLLTADLPTTELEARGFRRLFLNRSLRPWLQSIANWSFQHRQNPRRDTWQQSYKQFVSTSDPSLADTMPQSLTTLKEMARFWIPVWLTYQHWIATAHLAIAPNSNQHQTVLISDHHSIPKIANQSTFSSQFKKEFDRLIPAMPALSGNPTKDNAFHQAVRARLLNNRSTL